MRRALAHRWTLLVLMLATRVVAAEPQRGSEQRAAELKKAGDEAMDALRYDEAIDDYTKAYAISPNPALLYNRGRVYQARGEWPAAYADVTKFAEDATPELRARVPKLDDLIQELRSHVATLALKSNAAGARVLVRDRQIGTTPLAAPIALTAGRAHIEVIGDGYAPWALDVELQGGATIMLDVQLSPRDKTGVLRVRASTPRARILVDDAPAVDSPAESVVAAGSHHVVVRADGYDDREASVVVGMGETKDVTLEPNQRPPITGRWWFWTAVGVVVVGGAVTTYALLTEKSAGTGAGFQPGQVSAPLVRW